MFMETTAVRCESGTKHTNTLCGRGAGRPNVEGLLQGQECDRISGKVEGFLPYPKDLDVLWEPPSVTVQGTVLRPAAFSNGRQGASLHWFNPVMFVLVLRAFVNTVDLVTLHFQANAHEPLASSPHPVGPSTSTANSSSLLHGAESFLRS